MKRQRLLAVVGPTATGKTQLGVALAKWLDGEIVSADSMQIYKDMPIASALPTAREQQGVPHHMLAFLPSDAAYSVAAYVKRARDVISEIAGRGKLPIVVGGTGLYIEALLEHIEFGHARSDPRVRAELERQAQQSGPSWLYDQLKAVDPQTAARLHASDRRRVLRALEFYRTTGSPISAQIARSRQTPPAYDALKIGLNCLDRAKLYQRIETRVDRMLEQGLVEEARAFWQRLRADGAGQAIGHKEFYPYFEGKIALEQAVAVLKQQTRRYAKRQITWFRRDREIHWLYLDACGDVFCAAQDWIKKEWMIDA